MMVVVMGDPTPDRDESCEHWALIGECEKNPGYMLKECATSCHKGSNARQDMEKALMNIDSFFDLKANDLQGHVIDFAQFRNHITVITNVATYCGRTESHYHGLVQLWATAVKEQEWPVHILAFPCNQFGKQEPDSPQQIQKFAQQQGVEFTMMEKIDVNGPNTHIVYQYLKYHTNLDLIHWNFDTYFVLDGQGNLSQFTGIESPMQLLEELEKLQQRSEEL